MLSVKSKMTLEFEGLRYKYAGAKEQAIRHLFGESATRYYQRLGALLDDPLALAHDPQLVNRLRRLRDARRAQRQGLRTEG